tara:strand:- start:148 stop:1245 length:1098 start_codon:yes stop_codon:yes gene_type:complete
MANQKRNKHYNNHLENFNIAFELAKINLGSTKENPSVGCVVEKNGSIISSGYTSINGRPHAEYNALKRKLDYKNSNIYITLEPCSHYGKTPPCTNIIKKKGIKRVFYSIDDFDLRSKNKSTKIFLKEKISTKKFYLKKKGLKFYESYNRFKNNRIPLIDGKIAISKDFYTKDKKNKWITNEKSRKLVHLLRSKYNALLSTSKSVNLDNSLLDCRIKGLADKSPDIIILDRDLTIKKNLKLFKTKIKRQIYIFTTKNKKNKIKWLKKNKVKVFILKRLSSRDDFVNFFKFLTKLNFSRIFIETGLTFVNFLLKNKLLDNIYIFQTANNLNKNGFNYSSNNLIKKIKLKNKLKVYLNSDAAYLEKLK